MAIVNPPGWMQALSTHTAAQMRTYLASLQAGGYPDNTALRARGGVHPTFGTQLAVTQQGSPDMSVLVAPGAASIPGSLSSSQGNYFAVNDAAVTLSIAAAHATLPRIDIVVMNIRDAQYSGSSNDAQLQVITGTPASSPAAPTAPDNSITLAQVAVAALASSITNANITDTRRYMAAVGGVINATNEAARPGSGEIQDGQLVYSLSNDKLFIWDGSAYNQVWPGYTKISETVLSGTASSVIFSSIPQTFRALRIETTARGNFAGSSIAWGLRFNSDSSAVYNFQQLLVNGTSVTASQAQSETRGYLGEISGNTATASCAAQHSIILHNYTGTSFFKTVTTLMNMVTGVGASGMHVREIGTLWRNASAITTITLLPDSGDFVSGSTFTLYGMI